MGSEFYNSYFKKLLKDNDISMYSTHSEGKYVVADRFYKTLRNRIYKHMTTIVKNVYFDVLNDIVDKYNSTYHRPEYNEESNEKDPKFKVGDHIRISKFKNIFDKGYTPNWSEEIFVAKKNKKHCA